VADADQRPTNRLSIPTRTNGCSRSRQEHRLGPVEIGRELARNCGELGRMSGKYGLNGVFE
jgi:hypothetical protein